MGQTAGGVISALYVHSSAHLSGQSESFLTLTRHRWFYMLNWPKSCHKAIRATDSLSRCVRASKLYNVLPCIFLRCSCWQHYKKFGVRDNNTPPAPQPQLTSLTKLQLDTSACVDIFMTLCQFSLLVRFFFFFLSFVCLLGYSFYGIWWSVVKCLCNMFGEGWQCGFDAALLKSDWYISRPIYKPVSACHIYILLLAYMLSDIETDIFIFCFYDNRYNKCLTTTFEGSWHWSCVSRLIYPHCNDLLHSIISSIGQFTLSVIFGGVVWYFLLYFWGVSVLIWCSGKLWTLWLKNDNFPPKYDR